MTDEKSQLLQRLEDAGVIEDPAGWDVDSASGGLNTQVYFVTAGDGTSYTVRLGHAEIDLRREAEILESLAGCPGVASPVYYEEDILVHPTMPGESAPIEDANEDQIVALGRSLACIHSQEHAHYVIWPDLSPRIGSRRDLLTGRLDSVKRYRAFDEGTVPELLDLQHRLLELDLSDHGWDETHFSQIHGDLSVGNILWSEDGAYLVDWEYSRHSDPAEELAYIATEQGVSQATLDALRAGYDEGGGTPDTWKRVAIWAPFTALDSAFWWCDYLLERDEDPNSHEEVRARIAEAERWLDF